MATVTVIAIAIPYNVPAGTVTIPAAVGISAVNRAVMVMPSGLCAAFNSAHRALIPLASRRGLGACHGLACPPVMPMSMSPCR